MSDEELLQKGRETLPLIKEAAEKMLDVYGQMCIINYKISQANLSNDESNCVSSPGVDKGGL